MRWCEARGAPEAAPEAEGGGEALTKKLSDAIPNIDGGLQVMPVDQLLELRDAVVSEIRSRIERAEADLSTLKTALGEAA